VAAAALVNRRHINNNQLPEQPWPMALPLRWSWTSGSSWRRMSHLEYDPTTREFFLSLLYLLAS
jgi:hypothetical protein